MSNACSTKHDLIPAVEAFSGGALDMAIVLRHTLLDPKPCLRSLSKENQMMKNTY